MNGEYMLIYTTAEGGIFKSPVDVEGNIIRFTPEEFAEVKERGYFEKRGWDDWMHERVEPVFIALARIEDNHDFVLGRSRDEVASAS